MFPISRFHGLLLSLLVLTSLVGAGCNASVDEDDGYLRQSAAGWVESLREGRFDDACAALLNSPAERYATRIKELAQVPQDITVTCPMAFELAAAEWSKVLEGVQAEAAERVEIDGLSAVVVLPGLSERMRFASEPGTWKLAEIPEVERVLRLRLERGGR